MYSKTKKASGITIDSKTNKQATITTKYFCKDTNKEVKMEDI
jgi:hypothetical protein